LRASAESLTENSVDGIFGPLFWIFIGIFFMKFSIFLPGPLSLGFSYKAISTLDSMIGYKYDYFRYLGFFSAKIEDIFTFVPTRLVLITLPLVSPKINEYGSIIKKSYLDGKKYDSPNAGISEAIFAYISGIKLTYEKNRTNCSDFHSCSACNSKLLVFLDFSWWSWLQQKNKTYS